MVGVINERLLRIRPQNFDYNLIIRADNQLNCISFKDLGKLSFLIDEY